MEALTAAAASPKRIDLSGSSPPFTHPTAAPIPPPITPIRRCITFDGSQSISSYPCSVHRVVLVSYLAKTDQASPYPGRLAPYESRIEFNEAKYFAVS